MNRFGWLAALVVAAGCAHVDSREFKEPFLWDDSAPFIQHPRGDVVRASAVVIELLSRRGRFRPIDTDCAYSLKAHHVVVSETPAGYQVSVSHRPGLCKSRPEDTRLPPIALPGGADAGGAEEFAVSRTDFRIMRERVRSDPARP